MSDDFFSCHLVTTPTFGRRLSSVLSKFSPQNFFSLGCHPWMVHPGRSASLVTPLRSAVAEVAAQCCTSLVLTVECGVPLCLTHSFPVEYCHKSYILPSSRFFRLHFSRRQYGFSCNHCNVTSSKASEFDKNISQRVISIG